MQTQIGPKIPLFEAQEFVGMPKNSADGFFCR
jgi:hypothetical protein